MGRRYITGGAFEGKHAAVYCLAAPGLLCLLAGCGGGGAPATDTSARSSVLISTVAGSGVMGDLPGPGPAAAFDHPHSIAAGAGPLQGEFVICEDDGNSIRLMRADGWVTTLAGTPGGSAFADGHGASARFGDLEQVAVDGAGNIFATDRLNNRIRRITPAGDVSTVAGTGVGGNVDGAGDTATFTYPIGVASSPDGNLIYVAEPYDVRLLTYVGGARDHAASYRVTTLAGSGRPGFADGVPGGASFGFLHHIALVSNPSSGTALYITDTDDNAIRRVDVPMSGPATVTTVAGSGVLGSADGAGNVAQFSHPSGIAAVTLGNGRSALFVADNTSCRLRAITYNTSAAALQKGDYIVTTLAGNGSGDADGDGDNALFNGPDGIAAAAGPDSSVTLYIAEFGGNRIRKAVVTRAALQRDSGTVTDSDH